MDIPLGMSLVYEARHIAHILSLVSIAREGGCDSVQLKIAQPGRKRQDIHLTPRVVHIILAGDVITRSLQHVCKAGTKGRAAPVTNMQWASRVGRDKLDLNPPGSAHITASVSFTVRQYLVGNVLLRGKPARNRLMKPPPAISTFSR